MKSVTIKDLASILNLSSSTVSRALCDHSDISPVTRQKVLEAARKYKYTPNQAAQSLQNKQSNTIGVIVPEIKNSFFAMIIDGIEETAYQQGYSIMVCQSAELYEREVRNMQVLFANKVAGILLSPSLETINAEHINSVQKEGMPIVVFDRIMENLQASSVIVDDFHGAYNAVSFLIKKGYKRIGHLTGKESLYVSKQRKDGYVKALENNGIELGDEYVVHCGICEEDGVEGARKLFGLKKKPDAVFAFNDPVALGAMQYLQESGMKIPSDAAVMGFTNNPEAAIVTPPLTTVNQPAFEMGKKAAELLLQTIKEKNTKTAYQTVVLKTELVERETC